MVVSRLEVEFHLLNSHTKSLQSMDFLFIQDRRQVQIGGADQWGTSLQGLS